MNKKTVYLPSKVELEDFHFSDKSFEAYVFTPEQLKQLLDEYTDEILSKMYEKYHTVCEDGITKGVFSTQQEALDHANKLNSKSNRYHDWIKVTRLNGGIDKDLLKKFPIHFLKEKGYE